MTLTTGPTALTEVIAGSEGVSITPTVGVSAAIDELDPLWRYFWAGPSAAMLVSGRVRSICDLSSRARSRPPPTLVGSSW